MNDDYKRENYTYTNEKSFVKFLHDGRCDV